MGSSQSQQQSETSQGTPKAVRIERDEIPEEYKTVGVSHDVVRRVMDMHSGDESADMHKLRTELSHERNLNEQLRNELRELAEVKQKAVQTLSGGPAGGVSLDVMEERKRAFEETIERVEKKFFAYHRENVCESNEKEIMECLAKNKTRLLNCYPLVNNYKKCVSDFREQVLSEVAKA